jgi:hypothetical protein
MCYANSFIIKKKNCKHTQNEDECKICSLVLVARKEFNMRSKLTRSNIKVRNNEGVNQTTMEN